LNPAVLIDARAAERQEEARRIGPPSGLVLRLRLAVQARNVLFITG
jgi:hypothetical protein